MPAREIPDITTYLANEEIQQRIRQNIRRVRREAMVSIGEAARLLGFSESQLRDWEKLGLLRPVRPVEEASDTRSVKKQRQYSFEELDKLVIIHELLNNTKFTPGLIPSDIDQIWRNIAAPEETTDVQQGNSQPQESEQEQKKYIVRRVEADYREFFWRHYASRALLLSLMLLFEDVPNTYAGLLLPSKKLDEDFEPNSYNLAQIGEALVGWLGQTRSFYTFLTPQAEFEFPSDYQVHVVKGLKSAAQEEDEIESFLIVVPRGKVANLGLEETNVRLVQRLLSPIYEDKQQWSRYFGGGARDLIYPGMDFSSKVSDAVLGGLADMVIRLGGEAGRSESRWRFSCILIPEATYLPLQQRKLLVHVASQYARSLEGIAIIPTERYSASPIARAFISNHNVYRPILTPVDATPTFRHLEKEIRSSIALPIGTRLGQPLGVLYIASKIQEAFTDEDQKALRLVCRFIEEILSTYDIRQRITRDLDFAMAGSADPLFEIFPCEDDFINDIEALLTSIQSKIPFSPEQSEEALSSLDNQKLGNDLSTDLISFIAIELDDQGSLKDKYDNLLIRNLYFRVGELLERQLRVLLTLSEYKLPYHIYDGRFYLFLKNVSLLEARRNAAELKNALNGPYTFNSLYLSPSEAIPLTRELVLPDITFHLGVSSYPYKKLEEVLLRYTNYSPIEAVATVRSLITGYLDEILDRGQKIGGDVIMSWDRDKWATIPLS